jgi:glucose-1-phosphate thymidylyltransferase
MRHREKSADLTADQARIADSGLKAMIPVGRPFLDYVLTAIADAGIERACLVIGPEHEAVREYYSETVRPVRLAITFATQIDPRGTADAVLAAEEFAADDPFLVVNGDNHYPADTLRALARLGAPALAAFELEDLIATSNIPADRVLRFAVLTVDAAGFLEQIIEKPDPAQVAAFRPPILLSMNCWAFDSRIFPACRDIVPSSRGELELVSAVRDTMQRGGVRFRALRARGPVLDLSTRSDVASVTARLATAQVRL